MYGREMPEVVGDDDEQAIDTMHANNKGRERVPVRFITTLLLLGRFNADYANLTDSVMSGK
jgi:hypothetical protein